MTGWEIAGIFIGGGALGGVVVALIGFFGDRWKFKAERKAKKEDRAEEKADRTHELSEGLAKFEKSEAQKNQEIEERLTELQTMQEAQSEALKLMLLDRILYLGKGYIEKGEISFDDRKRLHAMHDCYHKPKPKGLGGNGDANLIMEGVDRLQLKT